MRQAASSVRSRNSGSRATWCSTIIRATWAMVIKAKAVPVVMMYAFMGGNVPCRLQVGHPGVTSGEAMRASKKKTAAPVRTAAFGP